MDKKITDVDFLDSLNSDESFFVNKNNSIKQINKSNIVFGINNGGTGATTVEEARENLGVASSEDLSNHMLDTNNPHKVSLEQIGAASESHSHTLEALGAASKPISFSITVPASKWNSGVQSVSISPNDTTGKNIIVVPSPESYVTWVESVARCSDYTATSLEFSCEDAPVKDMVVNILMLG